MYVVMMNRAYLNTFNKYSEAVALAEQMRRRFPKADIQIINL